LKLKNAIKLIVLAGSLLSILWRPVLAAGLPDLVLEDFNGNKVPVSRYIGQGKWTLVMLWAHNCPVCNQEAQNISFFHEEHKRLGNAAVLGVSVDGRDGVAKARRFVDNHLLDFPNLIADLRDDNLHRFGGGPFIGTPTFFVYSPVGELVGKSVGPISIAALEKLISSHAMEKTR
jgi:thiol-disulfide isomerase/thioredoxin